MKAPVEKLMTTGKEIMARHGLSHGAVLALMERGLAGFHPRTGRRYHWHVQQIMRDGTRWVWQAWESDIPEHAADLTGEATGAVTCTPEGLQDALDRGRTPGRTAREREQFAPFHGQADEIENACFRLADVDKALSTVPAPTAASNVKPRGHGEISQAGAAGLCGVGLRTIQKWESGQKVPAGYPGRSDALVLAAWAEAFKGRKRFTDAAAKMNRAVSVDPHVIEACCSESALDDAPDRRTLEEVIADQKRDAARDRR